MNEDHPRILNIKENFPHYDETFNFCPIVPEQISDILKNLNVNKATGHDFIPLKGLKYVEPALHHPLCVLFNDFLSKGTLPTKWKEGEITPVYKKGDQFDKTNYRPVSVLLAIQKVFEKCLHNQLSL